MAFMTRQTIIVMSILLMLLVLPPLSAQETSPQAIAELPLKVMRNRMVVNVPMAGYNLNLVLDTGASSTALFQSAKYDFSDMEASGKADIIFPALDAIVQGSTLKPQPITFGQQEFVPERLLLIDRASEVGDRLNFKFDGVLGQDFFNSYVVEIDPKAEILRLYPPGTDLAKSFKYQLKLHMKESAPHVQFHSKLPWEHIAVTKDLMLDTGYPGAMVIWAKQHFRQAARGENVKRLRETNTGIFTHVNFRVGKLRFLRTPIFLAPSEPVQAQERDGLIGANVLLQFRHVIDFSQQRLLLEINTVEVNHIDGSLYLLNGENFVVVNYEPPAAASVFVLKYQ